MFEQLVESRPERRRSTAQAIVSIAVHTALIAVSIQLTRAAARSIAAPLTETPMTLTRAPRPVASRVAAPAPNGVTAPPNLVPIAPPIDIPGGIPPAGIRSAFDPGSLNLTGRAGDSTFGLPPDRWADHRLVIAMQDADEQVRYLDGPVPKYPPALRHVGLEGYVQIRYIVDVDGRAEPESIQLLKSSSALFEAPAIEAILASRFAPARIHGHKVRQIVEQVVRFTLR